MVTGGRHHNVQMYCCHIWGNAIKTKYCWKTLENIRSQSRSLSSGGARLSPPNPRPPPVCIIISSQGGETLLANFAALHLCLTPNHPSAARGVPCTPPGTNYHQPPSARKDKEIEQSWPGRGGRRGGRLFRHPPPTTYRLLIPTQFN